MSYPARRCPYCEREMPEIPSKSGINRAIQKEIQLWRPWDTSPGVTPWNETVPMDSGTADIPLGDVEITYA